MYKPFTPFTAGTKQISATGTTGNVALAMDSTYLEVSNDGPDTVFVELGGSTVTAAVTAANVNVLAFYPAALATLAAGDTGTGDIYAGGVQAENATFASSLQPTTTGTAARNADVLTYPAAGNVNESGGSAYLEWFQKTVPASTSQVMYQIDDGSNVDILNSFVVNTTATFRNQTLAASVATGDTQTAGTISALASHKGAGRFTTNSFQCCLDGTLGTEDTSGALPTGLTLINVGSRTVGAAPFYAVMKNLRIAKSALSNGELVAISK